MTPILCMNCDKDMTEEARRNRSHLRVCTDCRGRLLWGPDGKIFRDAKNEWLAHAKTMGVPLAGATLIAFAEYEEAKYKEFKKGEHG
jgi:DNA-directed RNA polymerase subunit RPC12/RpoP